MQITTEASPHDLTVHINGELDHHGARRLREEVDTVIERQRPTLLRLDFSGVTFMDSSGIGFVMGRYRLMLAGGGRLRIVGATPRMKAVMRLAGLQRLPIWEQEEEK